MRKGFTIIEILIVILIIGILSSLTLRSYNKTRQAAELSLRIDNLMTDLREAKNQSKNATTQICRGFKFDDNKIFRVEAEYQNPITRCSENTKEEPYDLLSVERIGRSGQKSFVKDVTILFTPPLGESYIPKFEQQGENVNDQFSFSFSLGDKTNNQVLIFNASNDSISKEFREPETEEEETEQ